MLPGRLFGRSGRSQAVGERFDPPGEGMQFDLTFDRVFDAGGKLGVSWRQPSPRLGQLVGKQQTCEQQQALLTRLAHARGKPRNARIKLGGKSLQLLPLTLVAGNRVTAAVDGNGH